LFYLPLFGYFDLYPALALGGVRGDEGRQGDHFEAVNERFWLYYCTFLLFQRCWVQCLTFPLKLATETPGGVRGDEGREGDSLQTRHAAGRTIHRETQHKKIQ